jgi:peroxiredoxin
MKRLAIALLVGACVVSLDVSGLAQTGGKFNRKVAIGAAAPNFSGLPGVDGKTHSLADYSDKDVLVICVTCHHCPVAVAYEDRLIDFVKKSGATGKVALVAINVNNGEDDSIDKMREHAKETGFNFDFLHDASQQLGRSLGATVTPELYVFNKDRKLVYMGAFDDATNVANVKMKYLEPAVDAILKGQTPATAETRARGCSIEYQRKAS